MMLVIFSWFSNLLKSGLTGNILTSLSVLFSFAAFYRVISGCQRLEVDSSKSFAVQLANIVPKEERTTHGPLQLSWPCRAVSKDFVDDPDVPPLI